MIKPDNYDAFYDNDRKVKDDEEVTILTKYYKKDGVVCYSKSTKSVMIVKDRELTPVIEEEYDELTGEVIERPKITIYPVVALTYKRRKKSFYGIGEAQDVIPINKFCSFFIIHSLVSN